MKVSSSDILIASIATVFLSIILFPFLGALSVIMLPLVISLVFGYLLIQAPPTNTISKRKKRKSSDLSAGGPTKVLFFGSLCAFCISFLLMILLKPENFMNYLTDLPLYTMGNVHNFVVDQYFYQLILNNSAYKIPEIAFIPVTTGLTALFLFIFINNRTIFLKYGSNAILFISLVIFCFAAVTGNTSIRDKIALEPPDFGYSYDGTAYLKTFYLMENSNFYNAYVEAFSKHELAKSDEYKIVDGKFSGGFVKSPFIWREPFLFYLWNAITPGKGVGIYYLAIILSAAFLVLVHFCSTRIAGNRGALATIFVTPYLITTNLSFNFILPDHTGSMLLTSGILLWLIKKYKISAILFLLAMLCREVFLPIVIIVGALTFFANKRSALPYLGCIFSFILIYYFHYINASELIAATTQAGDALVPKPTIERFLSVSSFHLFTYFVTVIPSAIYFLLGAVFWYLKKRLDIVALFAFIIIYDSVASSPYWGQHFMYFLLISAAFLPAMLLSPKENISTNPSDASATSLGTRG